MKILLTGASGQLGKELQPLLAKLGMTRRTEVAALAARLDERQIARDT